MNGELAHRAGFTHFFQVAKARSGAGRPVDVRLAPTEVERRPLTTDNEDRVAIRVWGAEQILVFRKGSEQDPGEQDPGEKEKVC